MLLGVTFRQATITAVLVFLGHVSIKVGTI